MHSFWPIGLVAPELDGVEAMVDGLPKIDTTGIEIRLRFRGNALAKFLARPYVEIDGKIHKARWGRHYFPLAPGKHLVDIYFRHFSLLKWGLEGFVAVLQQDETRKIEYTNSRIFFLRGKIREIT